MIDLGETAVLEEANAVVTFERKSGGSYNDAGEWVGEVTASELVQVVVQPVTGQKLLDLPEGERADARYFLWTTEALAIDDVVHYAGARYRVTYVWDRRSDGGYLRAALGLMG